MPISDVKKNQLTFGGAVNASVPAHLIGQDQVQTAHDVDFSIERGAAKARRGYNSYFTTTNTNYNIFKSYKKDTLSTAFMYTGDESGVGRVAIAAGTVGAYTNIVTGGSGSIANFVKYRDNVYIAAGTALFKDDGTNTTEWIKQVPLAPSVSTNTGPSISIVTAGSGVTTLEGASTLGTNGTNTTTGDPATGRTTLIRVAAINLGTNSSVKVGTAGIIYANLGFSDPQNVYRVSVDFAVDAVTLATAHATNTTTAGTTTTTTTTTTFSISTGFQNFWHGEYLPNIGRSIIPGFPGADAITGAIQQLGTSTAISQDQITHVQSVINADQSLPQSNITFAGNVISNLAIPITNFHFVGTYTKSNSDAWQGLTAVRVTVESYVTAQTTLLTDITEQGDQTHCLTDMNQGYVWYQTFAEIDSAGNFIGESAASAPSTNVKCNNVSVTVTDTSTISGTQAGITHIITYRQGGFAQSPYAISTRALATATFTDTMADIQSLLINTPMVINVRAPNNVGFYNIVSDSDFYERIFLGNNNNIIWSEIGRPDQFIVTNSAQVTTDPGDVISGLVVWPPGLIIISWKSVHELTGSVFEGPNADFVIQKAAPRRGSIAPRTIIRTPHGIPLVNSDGITMYQPGAGVDVSIPWINEQIGDAFKGPQDFDPAHLNYARVPGINGNFFNACACWADGKLYLAAPTGPTSTVNDTVFVMDFNTQKCWWYQYQNTDFSVHGVNSLFWDFRNNYIYSGGINGVYQLETFLTEGTISHFPSWGFRTREWTVPNDTLVENLAVEFIGGPMQVTAIFDGTSTITVGTCSNTHKNYQHIPLNGLVTNNLAFQFDQLTGANSTSSQFFNHTAVYGVTWDSIEEPQKVHFYQTPYTDNGWDGDKKWDELCVDLGMLQANTPVNQATGTATITTTTTGTATTTVVGTSTISATGTVTAVTFIDGVSVMTNTIIGTGTPSAGRNAYTFSFPYETYGEIAYTTFTSTASGTETASTMGLFKLWDCTYNARNEPPKVTTWRTTIESLDEAIVDAFDVDINSNGTVLATAFVDNTPLMTSTITGSQRESYTYKLPVEVYGRTLYVLYNSGGANTFKHYTTMFHRRPEPDRWTNYVSERRSEVEQHFDAFEVDVNPLGNTVTATAFVDGTGYGTFTYTGSLRERFVNAFPAETYGKTVWAQYAVSSATDTALNPRGSRFKYFSDHFIGTAEPDRLNFVQKILPPFPSEHYVKTWIAELNPLGTCTGVLMVDGVSMYTSTFVGSIRETYNVGLELAFGIASQQTISTATAIEIRYTGAGGTGLFKHYHTSIESDPKPFGKLTWGFGYEKSGGVSQIDMARFWSLDVEVPVGPTVFMTSAWDIDGLPGFSTNTFTLVNGRRTYIDRIPFPPGGRGRLFQQRIECSSPVKIWRSTLDEEQIGAKGVARKTIQGTPIEGYYAQSQFASGY